MRISYYAQTDTLYIDLDDSPATSTRECAKDMVVDLNERDEPVGIEIEHASRKTDLSRICVENGVIRKPRKGTS